MKQQLITMLELQSDMNTKVHANWQQQNFPWYRAIWVECAELLDHYGWKWWKKQTPDIGQIALELVDIWHFGLSLLLLKGDSPDTIADHVIDAFSAPHTNGDFRLDLEDFTHHTLASKSFEVVRFAKLMKGIDMDFEQLYVGYVGKNVLNFFRQDHGYQDGSYHKQWGGKEDNEHLVEIVAQLDTSASDFKDKLYERMLATYKDLCQ
ncbi:MAG: dUTP diphosphatase [Porticoccaceae bacterium]|jgi:dimeric dUTPase (all-alpha-NTP-PPase superfamily)|nr:MAG: dUTP diphosphatase [SAR92 bacterium BACL16 MAG-120619-bin48]KRP25785.1 MAG: dUTP diphosphatase [SAR92 bacterium BACL16 MAG-120322-bin99]MDO7636646.1 dUTP diphosphatase [Porticoccaceae bacterium]MDP4655344.1 dUTP diphosphatase [Alphaproteobacteria bacterium]MDP4745683.1 dUTP diphosphatase [Porticoccaceae bacterium]|tara:strand:+ start:4880 stop:5500 length:621 start_codon:yes stop_codon:yes gene_type:complete